MKNFLLFIICLSAIVYSTKSQCNYSSADGQYKVSWFLDKESPSMVHFKLTAKQRATDGYWTGVGFGPGMSGGDLIIVSTVGDAVSVTDRHGVGFTEPTIDAQQNIRVVKSGVQNGMINVEFTRALDTGDQDDAPLKDPENKNCQQFIFPESGGKAVSLQSIRKHAATPVKKLICDIDKCVVRSDQAAAAVVPSGLPQRSGGLASGSAEKKSVEEAATTAAARRPLTTELGTDSPNTAGGATICPPRKDHAACKKYVDNYLEMVFTTFERNAANFQKACKLLIAQQQGLVNRECCNYLSGPNICRQFMTPS